jgi:integrase
LGALLEAWLANQASLGRRRLGDTERIIRGNVPTGLLDKPANAISSADLRNALAVVHQRGARVLANRLRAHLHALFQYGLQADHDPRRLADPVLFGITANPVTAIPRDAGAERVGERVIQIPEIVTVWHDDQLSWLARQAVRLLFATCGQRTNEIVQAPWSEFNLPAGVWEIPASRTKNKRAHRIPLTGLAIALLEELRAAYPGDWLFPCRNVAGAVKPWGNSALAHTIQHWHQRMSTPPWNPRDIRRSVKTWMGQAGIAKFDRDKLQNHAMTTDVSAKHYDRYGYFREMTLAAETWERFLLEQVVSQSGPSET